jgi:hypothetical protein
MNDSPAVLVHAKGLRKDYGNGEGLVRALDAIDLVVAVRPWRLWAPGTHERHGTERLRPPIAEMLASEAC